MPNVRITVAIVVVLLAGCGPAPTVPTTVAPVAAPDGQETSPTTAASTAARELPAGNDPLAPGTYTRAEFRPSITFEVGTGWFVGSLAAGFFDVQQQQNTTDVIAVQFGRVDGVVGADSAVTAALTAQAAAEAIGSNPALTVLGESESRLGGLTGFNLEVENQGTSHASIMVVPAGRLGIDSERRLWISLFDTDDGLLAVMVGGSTADWDHALALAEPVLESILIDAPAAN